MDNIVLVYFEGCPEAKNIRAALLNAGVFDFQVVKQNELPDNDPLKKLSSPSVLKGHELIYGIRTDGEIASCTFDYLISNKETALIDRFRDLKAPKPLKTKNLRSIWGTGLFTLLVLKCPACIPGVLAFFSTIGLGFIITPTLLKSVLVSLLLITLSGFVFSYNKNHQNIYPMFLAVLFSIALYVGKFYYLDGFNQILTYGGVTGLIGTSLWDLKLKKQIKCAACI